MDISGICRDYIKTNRYMTIVAQIVSIGLDLGPDHVPKYKWIAVESEL